MHNPNGFFPCCYLMARDHKAQPCHSGRGKHTQVSHDQAHAHREDTEETFSHDGISWHIILIRSSHFPSISSLPLFLQESMLCVCVCVCVCVQCAHTLTHTHTHTHTWRRGPTFLSVTLSLFLYLFQTDKIQFMTDLWDIVRLYVRAHVCFSCRAAPAFIIYVWAIKYVLYVCTEGYLYGVCVWRWLSCLKVKGNKSRDEASAMRFPG